MPVLDAPADGPPVAYALRAYMPEGEINQLIPGAGATTLRQIGANTIGNMRGRISVGNPVGHLVAIINTLSLGELNRLHECLEAYGAAAGTAFINLAPAQLAVLLAPYTGGRDATDILFLANQLLPLGVTPQEVHAFGTLGPGVSATDIVALEGALCPGITRPQAYALLAALDTDGLQGAQIRHVVTQLVAAGQTPAQVEALVTRLRGHLLTPANPQDPAARSITDVPALPTVPVAPPIPAPLGGAVVAPVAPGPHAAPVLPAHQQPGTKGLSGPEIFASLTATLAAPRAAPTIGNCYPTGQDFSPGQRTDDQLWDDCKINAAGAYLLNDTTTGVAETPAQRQIRQKLALAELRRRYAPRAALVQAIFAHDEGATPRPFSSIAFEDTYNSGAHNTSRHVLGGANMPNVESLAWRCMSKVPQCGAIASAFQTVGEANVAIQAALAGANFWGAYWTTTTGGGAPGLRAQLLAGVGFLPQITAPFAGGVLLRKTDPPAGAAYAPLPAPAPPHPRPLIHGMAPGAALPGPGGAPAAGPPSGYTYRVPSANVIVRFARSDSQAGNGWCVLTTYPT